MSDFSKKLCFFVFSSLNLFLCFGVPADEITPKSLADYQPVSSNAYVQNGNVIVSGEAPCRLISKKKLVFNAQKKYLLKASLKGQKGKFAVGIVQLDARGRRIIPQTVTADNKSLTALVADARKGDIKILVKNASNFKTGKYQYVVFNAKEDLTDLPNFSFHKIKDIYPLGDKFVIALDRPLKQSFKAGSLVRNHRDSSTFLYLLYHEKRPDKWMDYSSVISGVGKTFNTRQFWPGVKYISLLLLPISGKVDTSVKNASLVELD